MVTYLDNAASTPVRPEVLEAMLPFLQDQYGNPSGAHRMARTARRALDDARDQVASVVGGTPGDVVFTSGGTEADNLAVQGVLDRHGGVVVCGATEHHAVLDAAAARPHRRIPVGGDGVVDLDALGALLDESAVRQEPVLVSVMLVNNEVGTVQPVASVLEVVRDRCPDALVHTDAVQAPAWVDVASATAGVDLVSVSAHKVGGPKGIGALVLGSRAARSLAPRVVGGGQERDRRSGTQNVAGAVALGEALRMAAEARPAEVSRVRALRDRLADGLRRAVPGLVETGARVRSGADGDEVDRTGLVAGTCHVCLPGIESEALLFVLEEHELYASAAASCASGAMGSSHVLDAMGVAPAAAAGALRLSLGWASTAADVDVALAAVPPAVARLQRCA